MLQGPRHIINQFFDMRHYLRHKYPYSDPIELCLEYSDRFDMYMAQSFKRNIEEDFPFVTVVLVHVT